MTDEDKHKCHRMVHPSNCGYQPGLAHYCTRKATVFDGKNWWCKGHSPEEQSRRDEAKSLRQLQKVFGKDYKG